MQKELGILLEALNEEQAAIVEGWLAEVSGSTSRGRQSSNVDAKGIVRALQSALQARADASTLNDPAWEPLTEALDSLSRSRAEQGEPAGDTSLFVLALKRPLFAAVQRRLSADAAAMVDAVWQISLLVDMLAQRTMATYQQTRESIISRQQDELLELSTPVIKLWDGILAVPMIGTLDSSRTQIVMETLLQAIADTESSLAIIDITGVPTVDTLVAQHLLKTVAAIRLMGADCIISGIRPQIAQTIVHLGIDLKGITSKATLADALSLALERGGFKFTRSA